MISVSCAAIVLLLEVPGKHVRPLSLLQVTSDILMKARKYEDMAKENIEARLEVKSLKLDNQKCRQEVDKVNPDFHTSLPWFLSCVKNHVTASLAIRPCGKPLIIGMTYFQVHSNIAQGKMTIVSKRSNSPLTCHFFTVIGLLLLEHSI